MYYDRLILQRLILRLSESVCGNELFITGANVKYL